MAPETPGKSKDGTNDISAQPYRVSPPSTVHAVDSKGYNPMQDDEYNIGMKGYEVIEKTVKVGNPRSGRIYVPKRWEGCRVLIIRLDPILHGDANAQ